MSKKITFSIPVVELVPGASNVTGTLNLLAIRKIVNIQGIIYGLEEGFHGFHVLMKGELGNTCKDAGGHFNPDMVIQSFPFHFEFVCQSIYL